MRRIPSLLVAVALVASACAFDGPTADVRVVDAVAGDPVDVPAAGGASDRPAGGGGVGGGVGGGDDAPGAPDSGDDPAGSGLEDRPAALGALDLPSTVAVVGDSLTVAATDEIEVGLARLGVDVVVVDAQTSRRMATGSSGLKSGVAAVEDVLDDHEPDLWVVALGTNDVGSGTVPEGFTDDLRTILAAIPADAPVVWVDVWIRDRVDEVVEANRILRDELERRRSATHVVDWFESGTVPDVITGDGIHLTPDGERRFASAIADGVISLAIATG